MVGAPRGRLDKLGKGVIPSVPLGCPSGFLRPRPPGAPPGGTMPPRPGCPPGFPLGPPGARPMGPPGARPMGPPGARPPGPPGASLPGPPGVPPSATSKVKPQKSDPLMAMITQQNFDGSFSWGPSLESTLGMSEEKIRLAKPADDSLSEDVWLTAVVVAHLELRMAEQRDMWELVADKAYKFLKKSCDEELERMVTREAVALVEGPR